MCDVTLGEMRVTLAQRKAKADLWKTQCGSCKFYRRRLEYGLGAHYDSFRCVSPDAPALRDDGWRYLMGYEPHCDDFNANADCQLYDSRSIVERVYIPVLNFLRIIAC